MKHQWLSAHIFYSEPFEGILINGVKPFIEKLKKEKKIEGYFFIRYWERGPHIRLRIKADSHILKDDIKPRLLSYFTEFMRESPSKRNEPKWVQNLTSGKQWYSNNSIQFINYEPETARYGGEHTIAVAEEHFQHSSDIVLNVIGSNEEWNYDRALGTALQLHLSFVHATGLDMVQTRYFFNRVYKQWLPRANHFVSAHINQKKQKVPEKILEAFEKTLEKQKVYLVPFMESFRDFLERDQLFEETWLNEWIEKIKKTDEKLRDEQKNGNLMAPYNIRRPETLKYVQKEMLERWSIYYSFIHMTNNRLGILNRDEGYLGYLLKEILNDDDTK